MDSALRPRDIQARIRAGESAEDLAAASGTPIEKIMPYAAPVLAEREHITVRAQASSVRRRNDSGARTLGEAVEQQMHAAEADHESVVWDAWQREDRRWILVATYDSPAHAGIGQFVYDPRGNYVTCTDDDARWLVGDETPAAPVVAVAEPAEVADARDDLAQARNRRMGVVPDTTLEPTPESFTEPVQPDVQTDNDRVVVTEHASVQAAEPTVDLGETIARIRGARPAAPGTSEAPSTTASEETDSEQLALENTPEPAAAPKKRKTRNRASVPSWDEIMFGGGPTKD